ncbi:hypothetical protein STEG23_030981 [Scotinomys teguina]
MEVVAAAPRCQLLLILLMAAILLTGMSFTAACSEKNCQDHRVTRKHRQRPIFSSLESNEISFPLRVTDIAFQLSPPVPLALFILKLSTGRRGERFLTTAHIISVSAV